MSKPKIKQVAELKVSGKPRPTPTCEQYLSFSFRYFTKNSSYSIDALPAGNEREKTLSSLHRRLEELSCQSWLHWSQQRKSTGLETIPYQSLHFKAKDDERLFKDTDIYVFRFDTYMGNNKGRILGFKDGSCAILHIIGYDFDFSAYDH